MDCLFGTYVYIKDTRDLHYGIDTYPQEKENNSVSKSEAHQFYQIHRKLLLLHHLHISPI